MLRSASQQNRIKSYLLAVAITLLMVGARMLLAPIMGLQLPFITLFPAIFVAAWIGGLGPGLLATALGVVSATYLFMAPAFSLALADPVAQLGIGLFVLTGIFAAMFGESRLRILARAESAAEEARKSQDRYRALVERTAEGVWRIELPEPVPISLPPEAQIDRFYAVGELAECNDVMAQMYGFDRAAELVGARLADLLPRSDARNLEFLRAFVRSGYRLTDAESHEVGKDGSDRFFLNNMVGIVSDGHLVRAWGSQRDITS